MIVITSYSIHYTKLYDKNFKAFTLIELIIVMVIFSMLMTAIMIMMKPATELANTAIYYDSKRTIANEINTYRNNFV